MGVGLRGEGRKGGLGAVSGLGHERRNSHSLEVRPLMAAQSGPHRHAVTLGSASPALHHRVRSYVRCCMPLPPLCGLSALLRRLQPGNIREQFCVLCKAPRLRVASVCVCLHASAKHVRPWDLKSLIT